MSSESLRTVSAPSNRRTADFRSQKFRADRKRNFFRVIAKHHSPEQTVPNLRVLTKQQHGERTIYDWMSGKCDAPLDVCIAIIADILAG